ncbi:hypothetical protein [Marinobacter sp.]|uniref:hypothetical protein n=1 Tax=Marinobacter sp. TaxID=50741 RepID=UPI0035C749C6
MDHDAHVRAYHRHLIGMAIYRAMAVYAGCRVYPTMTGKRLTALDFTKQKRSGWTWKNHLANWINKTLYLLEKWGL